MAPVTVSQLTAAQVTGPQVTGPQVILNDLGSRALGRKVRAELLYAGFLVLDPPSRQRHRSSTSGRAGEVLVRIRSDAEVVLYIADGSEPNDHSLTLRRRDGEAPSFAWRVVEELRARLLDLGISLEDAPRDDEPSAALVTVDVPAPTPPLRASSTVDAASESGGALPITLWLRGGVGGVGATGGTAPSVAGALGVSLEAGLLQLGVAALVPFGSSDVSAREGEAEVQLSALTVEASLAHALSSAWRLSTGAGAGLLVVSLHAEAEQAFLARDDRLLAGVYYLQTGLTWSASEHVRVRGTGLLGLAAPRPVLRFDQRDVASIGTLLGCLMLQVEVGLLLNDGGRQ